MGYPAVRRRRWPLRLLIVLVVLLGLLIAADRIGAAVAERIAGTSIQDSQHLAQRPDVDIAGFPFLTQLAASSYDSVQITGHDIPVGPSDRTLNLDTVTVHLHHVTTARDFSWVRADTATADARASFDDVARTLGVRAVSSDGPGRLKTSASVTVAGQSITGGISAAVSASSDQGLTFSDIRVDAGGVSVSGADTALGATFRVPIPLSGLPFDVRVTGLSVDSSGLDLHLAGTNLSYTSD